MYHFLRFPLNIECRDYLKDTFMRKNDIHSLRQWFLKVKRDFPWRKDQTPYSVWVSEIMLQQTQASVVVDYFNRWMEAFPTVHHLANASEEKVLKLWEGLGYYSRARNLQKGAHLVVRHFRGKIPTTKEQLSLIPGIGFYTQGAIRSFAFKEKAPAIDTNVSRVIYRYYGYEKQNLKFVETQVDQLLPDKEPHVVMEALIELGALCCKKRALCAQCPIQKGCLARQLGLTEKIPKPKKRALVKKSKVNVIVFHWKGKLLLEQRSAKLWKGMWQFPPMPLVPKHAMQMPSVLQAYTCYREELFPYYMDLEDKHHHEGSWIDISTIFASIPLTASHRKIFNQFVKLEYPTLWENYMMVLNNGGNNGTGCVS